ncbi:MAG: hypothetical protein U0232_18835 [Thermomicrobiales bacterium]
MVADELVEEQRPGTQNLVLLAEEEVAPIEWGEKEAKLWEKRGWDESKAAYGNTGWVFLDDDEDGHTLRGANLTLPGGRGGAGRAARAGAGGHAGAGGAGDRGGAGVRHDPGGTVREGLPLRLRLRRDDQCLVAVHRAVGGTGTGEYGLAGRSCARRVGQAVAADDA